MNKYIKYFITITKHKYYVMKFCFKCGLYKQGLLHDLSKYSPIEFYSSARHFQSNSSPINAEKKEKGYSLAWQHHQNANPHHWEYWIDWVEGAPIPCKIPYKYVLEMICDWLGAGIVYSKQKVDFNKPYGEPLNYYNKLKKKRFFCDETQKLIETYLEMIAEKGINYFCKKWNSGYLIIDYIGIYCP